jgi:tetratricopeptide (TPR) repeat protein
MKKIITILVLLTLPLFALNEQAAKFIWDEANSTMFTAKEQKDFIKAADIYNKLIRQDVNNQFVYYNLGVAYLLSEQYNNALSAFLKSEQYSGTTPELEACIANAYSKSNKSEVLTLPWYRILLFPHFKISFKYRLIFSCIAYSLIWLGMIMKIFKVKIIANRLIVVSIIAFAVTATSLTTSIITLKRNFITNNITPVEN